MKSYRKLAVGSMLLLALIFFVTSVDAVSFAEEGLENTQSSYSNPISPLDSKLVLNYIAAREGISVDRLFSMNEHKREYPELKATFLYVKAMDKQTHQIYDAMLDLNSRDTIEVEEVETKNSSTSNEKYGKLEPRLYQMLQTKNSDELVSVAVWFASNDQQKTIVEQLRLRYPQVPLNAMERPWLMVKDKNQAERIRKDYFNLLKQANLAPQQYLAQWLSEQGLSARLHSGTPSLVGRFPKSIVLQIAQRPEVEQIYLVQGKLIPLLNIAVPTTKAGDVWNKGYQGTDQRVAIIEPFTVPMNHPSINVIAVRNQNILYHTSGVASAIASHHAVYKGVAPAAQIVSAGVNTAVGDWGDVDDAILWANETYGANIMNASFTTDTGDGSDDMEWIDRVFDYYARYYLITMVAAAGNQEHGNHTASPAKGYNVLAVGGTDDQRTTAWDDQIWASSSWKNPKRSDGVYGDREKPEIVASAYNLTLLNQNNQTYGGSGTSYAAPQVAGLAALLADRNQELYELPEAMRAIIMATAWNNVDGPTGIPTGQDLKDGAGAIDASSADTVAITGYTNVNQYPYPPCQGLCWWSNYVYNSDFPVGSYRYYDFMANAGERIRVAIAWDSDATGSGGNYGMDPLRTDLDLVIFDPVGDVVPNGYSASYDNSYELVDFHALKTGVHRIGIYKKSNNNELYNWIGIAWTKGYHICMPLVLRGGGVGQAASFFPYPAPGNEYTPSTQSISPYPAP